MTPSPEPLDLPAGTEAALWLGGTVGCLCALSVPYRYVLSWDRDCGSL